MKIELTTASYGGAPRRMTAARDTWQRRLRHTSEVLPYVDWLAHTGSLTQRLRECCADFNVRLVRQVRARPFEDERAPLGIPARESAWIREVVLRCGERPVIFAHTVLPAANERGAWHLLAGLGARPLGELLFTDPLIAREPLRFARIDARHPLHARARAATGTHAPALWARRSLFRRQGRAILVTEIFLPAVLGLSK